MKVSYHWLQHSGFIKGWPQGLHVAKLAEQLTMAGLEIEAIEDIDQDKVLELSITPNRGDCLSIRGLMREIACLNQVEFHDFKARALPNPVPATDFIRLSAPEACPLYAGSLIQGISQDKKTPTEILNYLTQAGIASIHPVVDICNYVMLELGQPLHVFDADKIDKLEVRFAKVGEKMTVLGGQTVELLPDTLVIADRHGPQAMAGIIGGAASAVDDITQNIFLESAHFMPLAVAGVARRYGLQTDAAFRFERGVDPALPWGVMHYASELIVKHLGGTIVHQHIIADKKIDHLIHRKPIHLRPGRIERILGIEMTAGKTETILQSLGMKVVAEASGWGVTPPTCRFDINEEIDLIEEIARIYGYQNVPLKPTHIESIAPEQVVVDYWGKLRQILVNRDYHEIISYSFISEAIQQQCLPHEKPLKLLNPISTELAVMRTSLWPSLLQTLQYNLNRQQPRVRLFEIANTYQSEWSSRDKHLVYHPQVAGLIAGSCLPEQWDAKAVPVDFYTLKSDVEMLLSTSQPITEFTFQAAQHPMLHPGQSAQILFEDKALGWLGRIHPQLQQDLGLEEAVYLFEISTLALSLPEKPAYQGISKFPYVRRDFAFLVARDLAADHIIKTVRQLLGHALVDITIFDVYEGKSLPDDQKSIAFAVILQNQQETLLDEQVNAYSQQIIDSLTKEFSAKLRDGI